MREGRPQRAQETGCLRPLNDRMVVFERVPGSDVPTARLDTPFGLLGERSFSNLLGVQGRSPSLSHVPAIIVVVSRGAGAKPLQK